MKKKSSLLLALIIISLSIQTIEARSLFSKTKKQDNQNNELDNLLYSAENNVPVAQCLLGLAYRLGNYGLEKDHEKGMLWITKAATNGYMQAQEILAGHYRDIETDYEKSWYWALKAAHQGSGESMRLLAGYSILGNGCAVDMLEHVKWLLLSASTEDSEAKEWLSGLDQRLNIYEKREFFDAYIFAEKWLLMHPNLSMQINRDYKQKFIEKFEMKACQLNRE